MDGATLDGRLTGKNTLFNDEPASKSPSALVTGRKRNRGDPASKLQARQAAEAITSKRKDNGHTSLRKARRKGGIALKGNIISYTSLLPLHYLHVLYLCKLLSLPPLSSAPVNQLPKYGANATQTPGGSAENVTGKLLKADFTGIRLKVLASRNASLIGIEGLVIEETESTFRLVPTDSRVRVVPKDGTQFHISFPAYAPVQDQDQEQENEGEVNVERHLGISPRIELSLLGTNFCYRSADRAGRKFKLAHGGGGNGWGNDWVSGEWSGILDADKGSRLGVTRSEKGGSRARTKVPGPVPGTEKGLGAAGMRKKGKSRRKDPFAGGSRQVTF